MAQATRRISSAKVVGAIVIQGVLLTLAGMALWHLSGRPIGTMLRFNLVELAQGVLMAGGMIATAALTFHSFPQLRDHLVRLQSELGTVLGPLRWPAILVLSLSAGISEEVLLRAGLQTLLANHLGIVAAIVIASAVFGAMHLAKPLITALLVVIGLLFGTVYWLTDSLLTVIVAHALYDVWALRYLMREMARLGLFDNPGGGPDAGSDEGAASLVNPAQPG